MSESVAVTREFYAALERGDLPGVIELVAEQVMDIASLINRGQRRERHTRP